MRQRLGDELLDAEEAYQAAASRLGLLQRRESDIKEIFRRCHKWLQEHAPGHLWHAKTIDANYADYLATGRLPEPVLRYYLAHRSEAPA